MEIIIESTSRNGLIKMPFNQDLILLEQIKKLYSSSKRVLESSQLKLNSTESQGQDEQNIMYNFTRE